VILVSSYLEITEKVRIGARREKFFRCDDTVSPTQSVKSLQSHPFMLENIFSTSNQKSSERNRIAFKRKAVMSRALRHGRKSRYQAIANEGAEPRLRSIPSSNFSGVAFNIINHEYHNTEDGQKLRQLDDLRRIRRNIRGVWLLKNNHIGFDPITGAINEGLLESLILKT
jgi:hypothetical protein